MARPRNTNESNILSGNWAHNPDRARPPTVEDDEEISPTAPMLELITFDQAWAAVIEMVPPGVLKRSHEIAVFETARCYMVVRNLTVRMIRQGGDPDIKEARSINLRNWLAKLGCTPVDGNHIHQPKGQKAGDFD